MNNSQKPIEWLPFEYDYELDDPAPKPPKDGFYEYFVVRPNPEPNFDNQNIDNPTEITMFRGCLLTGQKFESIENSEMVLFKKSVIKTPITPGSIPGGMLHSVELVPMEVNSHLRMWEHAKNPPNNPLSNLDEERMNIHAALHTC